MSCVTGGAAPTVGVSPRAFRVCEGTDDEDRPVRDLRSHTPAPVR